MTEAEWLAATSPRPMLEYLRGRSKATPRRSRLFACACCRRIWHLMKHECSRQAVENSERLSDITTDQAEWTAARSTAWPRYHNQTGNGLGGTRTLPAAHAAYACTKISPIVAAFEASHHAVSFGNQTKEKEAQAQSLRCIFGNPFRTISVDPLWLTFDVIALAAGIYSETAFDRLPILADALQDAGCGNADILGHCREPGPHVRGCWVADLVLGKE